MGHDLNIKACKRQFCTVSGNFDGLRLDTDQQRKGGMNEFWQCWKCFIKERRKRRLERGEDQQNLPLDMTSPTAFLNERKSSAIGTTPFPRKVK
jgi:hypothetical protein